MDGEINEDLGVNEEYAEEIRERMDEPSSLLDGTVEAVRTGVPADATGNKQSGQWIALLVAAMMEGIRETERRALDRTGGNETARKQAVSLYQERMIERALDGTLFNPLEESHPETFEEILTDRFPEWAVETAVHQLQELQDAR